MLKEERELRGFITPLDIETNPGFFRRKYYRRYFRLIREFEKAVREDAAKECDSVAELYRALRDKGPKEYSKDIDMDTLRMFAAEECAATIRRK